MIPVSPSFFSAAQAMGDVCLVGREAAEMGAWFERTWDFVEARIKEHRRKTLTFGFFVFFLPQWGPPARDMATWLWRLANASGTAVPYPLMAALMDVGFTWWNAITAPLGAAIMLLVWFEIRKSERKAGNAPQKALEGDGQPSSRGTDVPPSPPASRVERNAARTLDELRASLSGLPVGDGHAEAEPSDLHALTEQEREERATILLRQLGVTVRVRWRGNPNGLDVEALNISDDVVDGFRLFVIEMLRRTSNGVFGKVVEFHNNDRHSFARVELRTKAFGPIDGVRLFPGTPVPFNYLRVAPGPALTFGVPPGVVKTGGRWRTDFAFTAKDHKEATTSLEWEWRPGDAPVPWPGPPLMTERSGGLKL